MKRYGVGESRPALGGQESGHVFLNAIRIIVLRKLEPLGDPSEVRVYDDGRLVKAHAENDIGGLSADSRKRQEIVHV